MMESMIKNPSGRTLWESMKDGAASKKTVIVHDQTKAGSPVFTPTTFDTNIVIITAALLFVLICALGMNALIKCVLSWTRRLSPQEDQPSFRRRPSKGINKTELKLLPTTIFHQNKQMPSNTQENNGANHVKESGDCNDEVTQADDQEIPIQDSQCPICLSDFQDGDKVRVLPLCNHGFHKKCVDAWLSDHSSCPTCRAELTPFNKSRMDARAHLKKSTQVQLEILISPSGTLTPTIYRVLPSSEDSSVQRFPDSSSSNT